ncbi:yop-1 [Symbiodinium sp. CCMP2592]|nr:yop-1 [Symbiodinium sp. CCMP2592]
MHKGMTMVPVGRWSTLARTVAPGAFRRFHSQDSARFVDALCERRVLFVSGSNARGRASVAAAAALARACNQGPSLLVDADDPVHGMADVLGEHELPSDGRSLLWLEAPVQKEQQVCQASIAAAQLCAWTTREFLEELLAAKRWRALLEDGTGARLVAAMGMPMQELLGVLDCVQPPPGAEMPVALAQLLQSSKEPMRAVVDAGAPALAVQLQSVPPAVAEGLGGVLRLQELVKAAKQAAVPSAVSSGLQMLIGSSPDREDWRDHFKVTMAGLQQLRQDMAALAEADTGVLLVVHWPGPGERAAQRVVDRLSPVCAVLVGFPGDVPFPFPKWLSGIPTVSLPAFEEMSPGLGGLRKLSEAMLRT